MRLALVAAIVALTTWPTGSALAQPQKLELRNTRGPREAEPPTIELLTFGVGDRIFEKFGHAALCFHYHDPSNRPICFNYGVTDFRAGAIMIWRFLRSEQKFWVEPSTWGELYVPGTARPRGMIGFYSWEDRDIWSQVLPLTPQQARAIEDRVWDSLREDHRYYYYDHFRDNCTTRLRDVIDDVTGGKLRDGTSEPYPLTYREMGRRGLSGMPALVALTDFVIGRQTDETPTVWEAMFHPDVLRQMVQVKLGVTPQLIYKRHGTPFPVDGPSGRPSLLLVALVFSMPLLLARRVSRQAARLRQLGIPRLASGEAASAWKMTRYGVAVPILGIMTFAIGALCLWIGFGVGGVVGAGIMILGLHLDLAAVAMSERMALVFAVLPLAVWGIVLYGLAIASEIPGVRWNEAVLVLMPFDAVLPFLGEVARRRYARLRVAGLALVSLLCAIGVLRQPLWVPVLTAFLPLAILAFDLPRWIGGKRADDRDPELPRAVALSERAATPSDPA